MARRIPTLSSNETFRKSLTIHEATIWDTVKAKGFVRRQELADSLSMTAELADKLYASAQAKFLKYATRSEM